MKHSGQGIIRNKSGEEQPRDKRRAQTVHETKSKQSVSREATRDPKLSEAEKTPGAGAMPDDSGDAGG